LDKTTNRLTDNSHTSESVWSHNILQK